MGFSYIESYNLPVWQRIWFIKRLQKEIKRSQDKDGQAQQPTHAAHQNTPDARAMMGRYRHMVPAKLRRFT